eukprot:scaffold1001_cov188-Ochromonas_danica.AAC.3
MFEEVLSALDHEGNPVCPDHFILPAKIGIARCQLRVGNLRQGIRMANEIDHQELFEDCGTILEEQKQYSEAAAMFVKSGQLEKAALIYTKYLIKNDKGRISEAAVILEKVNNDALNAAFAKACLGAGRYDDALRAYQRAHDNDKVVEILLRNLDQVQQAFDLVRNGASAQAAQLVAEYCIEQADHRGAIEFLLMANKSDDAFKLAQANNIMDIYCSFLSNSISSEDALKVAHYYEKSQDFGRAGRYYSLCGQYQRALRLFLQCGDREIDAAIEVVGKSQNEALTHQLIDFLVGEKDGIPKDPNYIYRLYLALKKYDDAAKTALVIARQEQDLGNYPAAHAVLVETIRQLEDQTRTSDGSKITLTCSTKQVESQSNLGPETVNSNDGPLQPQQGSSSRPISLTAPDPILGKSVAITDLVKATAEEALAYIRKYNNVIEKEAEESQDGDGDEAPTPSAASNGEGMEEDDSVRGGGSRATADEDGTSGGGIGGSSSRRSKGSSKNNKASLPPSRHAKAARMKMERMAKSKRKKESQNK